MALPTITNADFESPLVSNNWSNVASGWTIAGNGGGVDSRTVIGLYDGSQILSISYGTVPTTVSQAVACDGTPFQLRLAAKYRSGSGNGTLRISFAGSTVADIATASTWAVYTTPTITPPGAGTYTLQFSHPENTRYLYLDALTVLSVAPSTSPLKLLLIEPGSFGLIG